VLARAEEARVVGIGGSVGSVGSEGGRARAGARGGGFVTGCCAISRSFWGALVNNGNVARRRRALALACIGRRVNDNNIVVFVSQVHNLCLTLHLILALSTPPLILRHCRAFDLTAECHPESRAVNVKSIAAL
jgi:hypothetical protein